MSIPWEDNQGSIASLEQACIVCEQTRSSLACEQARSSLLDKDVYGDLIKQANANYKSITFKCSDIGVLINIFDTLSNGLAGSGNYLSFHPDKLEVVSDVIQLGFRYFITITAPSFDLEPDQSIYLRTDFAAIKSILSKTKAVNVPIHIKTKENDVVLEFYINGETSSDYALECSAITIKVPEPAIELDAKYQLSSSQVQDAFAKISASGSDIVRVYIAHDKKTCHLYSYDPVTMSSFTTSVGDQVNDGEFEIESGKMSLKPTKGNYWSFQANKKATKCISKMAHRAHTYNNDIHVMIEIGEDSQILCFCSSYYVNDIEHQERVYIYN